MFRLSRPAIVLVFALFLVAAMPTGFLQAQQLNVSVAPPAVPVLQLHTYGNNWLRYHNRGESNAPKLAIDGVSRFPFRFVISVFPLGLAEMEGAAAFGTLYEKYDLEYDETRIDGYCDSAKLSPKSTDVFCAPGPCELSDQYVFLVLYHPENKAIVALTTTIDNFDGVAAHNSSCPVAQAVSEASGKAQVNGEVQVNGEAQADGDAAGHSQTQGCGPYAPGQWIKQADYAASDLNLPIVLHEFAREIISDYQCIAPDDGAAPYLLAYTIDSPPPKQSASEKKPPCSCQSTYSGQPFRHASTYKIDGIVYCDCCYGDGRVGYVYQIGE
ncbi:MAG: hypothetical protein OXI30_07400 [Chloroflexota bacterium]|nr:hypothetical protein [Chloroflexota bacterium]